MTTTARRQNLERLLRPRHVALIGGDALIWPIKACERAGYAGEIWVVNPNRAEIAGRPCYASLADLPAPPDASFVAVRREASVGVVRELAAMGAGGCVCYAAGFSEIGGDGPSLQDELAAAAGDLAVVGPNCFGVLNYIEGVALWADQHGGRPVERGVAIVSQSGNISLNLTMAQREVPLAYVVSVGNQAVLGIEDFVDALADDPRITAIGLYIEGLRDVAGFSRAAARALVRGVPIVALKVGTSDLGAQVAFSHTSSLAGSDRLYQALFDRLGVVRVGSIPALLETLKLLSVTGPVPGPRLRVLTCSGGESALTADLAEKAGLTFPPFSPEQIEELRALLPVFATVANPLDYNTAIWGKLPALTRCCTTAMSGDCDAAMLVIDYPDPAVGDVSEWDTSVDAFVAGHEATGRPAVVTSTLSELLPRVVRERLAAAGVAPMQGLSETVAALGAAVSYDRLRRSVLAGDGAEALVLPAPPAPREDATLLDEWTGKRRLAEFGLSVPEGRVAGAAEAPGTAAAIGFPVVVKAVGAGLAHKTEAGAVVLNLWSETEVAAAVAGIRATPAGGPGGHDRFLVEPMVSGAVAELILGVKRDPVFGLALVVGAGGVLVELMGDVATLLLPTDREAVLAALSGLKGAKLLTGYRGRPKGDLEAVADAALAVARFAEAHRERLLELDVNPLLVLPAGQGVVAVDALIRMAE